MWFADMASYREPGEGNMKRRQYNLCTVSGAGLSGVGLGVSRHVHKLFSLHTSTIYDRAGILTKAHKGFTNLLRHITTTTKMQGNRATKTLQQYWWTQSTWLTSSQARPVDVEASLRASVSELTGVGWGATGLG